MSDTLIKIENLSKQYRLGLVGTGTLSHDLNRWWYKIRGKEDPYLKIGQNNDLSKHEADNYVWALRDINLDVKRGEVLGIIGKNGAGKSTLLKILSQVTGPTTGTIKVKGRIGSLLEVGTGFHPELTGRENIFLNGAILGMTKSEIKRKLDEIIDFSGTSNYINTPVKRYSSGMKVRLAFAVAAHLDPEILVVDEVLAVGDAEFQKRAIGKMEDITSNQGRTILFVSHNMGAVKQLCQKGILLKNGAIDTVGDVDYVVDEYLKNNRKEVIVKKSNSNDPNYFTNIKMLDAKGNLNSEFDFDEDFTLAVSMSIKEWNDNLELSLSVYHQTLQRLFTKNIKLSKYINADSDLTLKITFKKKFLLPGNYSWIMCINHPPRIKNYDLRDDILPFSILETGSEFYNRGLGGFVFPPETTITSK